MVTYNAYLDGKKVKEGITESPFNLDGLEPSTLYSLTLTEVNSEGKESIPSDPPTVFKTYAYVDGTYTFLQGGDSSFVLGKTYEVAPDFMPSGLTNREWEIHIVSGEDIIETDGKTITAKALGEAEVEVVLPNNETDYHTSTSKITVVAEEVPVESFITMDSFDVSIGEYVMFPTVFTPENTTQKGFKIEVVEGNAEVLPDRYVRCLGLGDVKIKLVSTSNPEVFFETTLTPSDKPELIYLKNPLDGHKIKVGESVVIEAGVHPEGLPVNYSNLVLSSVANGVLDFTFDKAKNRYVITGVNAGKGSIRLHLPDESVTSKSVGVFVE